MRYPPALTFTPGRSWVYCALAVLFTIFFIALGAAFMRANGLFHFKSGLFLALSALASLYLLHDAWRRPQGSLHYSQGQWRYLHGEHEIAGTCTLHLDLQTYMLVRFTAHSVHKKLIPIKTQWFHLEARHANLAAQAPANPGAWSALRRAVYSPMEPADEALAA